MEIKAISKATTPDGDYIFFYERLVKKGKHYYWDWIISNSDKPNRDEKLYHFFRKRPNGLIRFRNKDLRFQTTANNIINKFGERKSYNITEL